MRTWLDRSAAAYDYAARIPGDSPQAAEMKWEMLRTVSLFWDSIEHSGLANDDLRMDWSVVCQRLAQDGQASSWMDRASTSLAQVSPAGRDSDYYALANAALKGTDADDKPLAQLNQWLKAWPSSWSVNFLAWKLDEAVSAAPPAVNNSGHGAYLQFLAARWHRWIIYCVSGLILIPAWICLRKPFPRRKRSERLQKLWPLALTLCLVFGTSFVAKVAVRYLAAWLRDAPPWLSFVSAAGPQWAEAAWQLTFASFLCCTPWVAKAGLSAGWGSTWQVLGIEWKDFVRPRLVFTGFSVACIFATLSSLLKQVMGVAGWGNPLLDAASRWPFSQNLGYSLFMLGFMLVLAPLVEEVVYRGYLFATLRRRFSPGVAIVLTAVLFAAAHGYSLRGTISVFFGGIALGCIRHQTGRLASSIILHASINALAYVDLAFLNFG